MMSMSMHTVHLCYQQLTCYLFDMIHVYTLYVHVCVLETPYCTYIKVQVYSTKVVVEEEKKEGNLDQRIIPVKYKQTNLDAQP